MMVPLTFTSLVLFANLMVVEVDVATKTSVTVVKLLPDLLTAWLLIKLFPLITEAMKSTAPFAVVAMSKDITYC